jgi:hypothetical protein
MPPSKRVDRALDALALEVVWLPARRARDYMRAYVAIAGENEGVATALQKQEIEEQEVEQKKHRDALDLSSKWVKSQLCARARRKKGGPSNKYAKRPLIGSSPPANPGQSRRWPAFFRFRFFAAAIGLPGNPPPPPQGAALGFSCALMYKPPQQENSVGFSSSVQL